MSRVGREAVKATAYFVLGALTMLLLFVLMVWWYGR
jgi:hypothetical protein